MTDVFMDNKFIGTIKNPAEFTEQIISDRRLGKISVDVNALYVEKEDKVLIETSRGRSVRPLIVVKDGKSTLTEKHLQQLDKNEISWSDLIKQGVVEYLDSTEEESSLVAFRRKK
jgi:DNA-directed RNA polymerase beta subunit